MKKLLKLFILIVISMSVYFIYHRNQNAQYTITSIGDKLSLGVNSYDIKDYSYIDYYKEYIEKEKDQVEVNKTYSKENQTIKEILLLIKETPEIRRTLYDTDCLIITLGYNDLLERLALIESKNNSQLNKVIQEIQKDYEELITEIRKYYKEEIIVIGYYDFRKEDTYQKLGIIKLNQILNNDQVTFINTDNILKNHDEYFSNPSSYYPNNQGYECISKEIIRKTLEKKENI